MLFTATKARLWVWYFSATAKALLPTKWEKKLHLKEKQYDAGHYEKKNMRGEMLPGREARHFISPFLTHTE